MDSEESGNEGSTYQPSEASDNSSDADANSKKQKRKVKGGGKSSKPKKRAKKEEVNTYARIIASSGQVPPE